MKIKLSKNQWQLIGQQAGWMKKTAGGGDMVDKIIAYEDGNMSEVEVIKFFQELVDSGDAWRLQGHYGRTAQKLIDAGLITLGKKPAKDYFGNTVPSKHQVIPYTPGSEGFVRGKN